MMRQRPESRKKRAMILTSSHMIGGFETRSTLLIHHLDKERFDVFALLVYPGYKAKKVPEQVRSAQKRQLHWEGKGIEMLELRMRSRVDVTVIMKAARLMRRKRIDVLLFFALGSGTFLAPLAARLAGVKRVIRAGGTVLKGLYPDVLRPLDKLLLRWTDRVVVPSCYLKDLVVRQLHIRPHKVSVIPNGIDVRRFEKPASVRGIRHSLDLPASARIVGMVANLIPVKDHAVLIHSAPRILENVPDAIFLIVGDGPLKPALKRLSRELRVAERFRFLGYRSDVERLMSVMDVGVLCSRTETFGNVLLEMMAAGVPVVAPRVGAVPELIQDGRSGLLVRHGDPEDLAAAVIRLVKRKAEAELIIKNARDQVKSKFSVDVMIGRYEDILATA